MKLYKNICLGLATSVLGVSLSWAASDDLSITHENQLIKGSFNTLTTEKQDISFSLDYANPNNIEASLTLGENAYAASVNPLSKQVSVSAVSIEGEALIMTPELKKELKHLNNLLVLNKDQILNQKDQSAKQAVQYLFKLSEFLISYPMGEKFDKKIQAQASIDGWVDLCPFVGRSRTARWDNDAGARSRNYIVGGHGFCAGRCGAGCNWAGDPQYSQDCLNHDACADVEGEQLGVCADEWQAASDDFWFSPDCPS